MSLIAKEIELFPTYVYIIEDKNYKQYKKNLVSWLQKRAEIKESITRSNVGGYHSEGNFWMDFNQHEYCAVLDNMLKTLIGNNLQRSDLQNMYFQIINSWYNINNKNQFNKLHCHPGSQLSAVFWVQTPENCGDFVFYNPNQYTQHENIKQRTIHIKPEEGKLLVFPSCLMHEVLPNKSNQQRISIAINLKAFS